MKRFLLLAILLASASNSSAQVDPARKPTPLWRAPLPSWVPPEPPPVDMGAARPSTPIAQLDAQRPAWARFERASRCEQRDGVMWCDNGYREETAR